ncbi:acyl-CoA dehydrogenase NM domain-like protein [Mycena olivaceomarginata]|nr:acyl-CoA dehydrogenase NM domain-like protein [Mycena olivaceomarginata]
MRVEDVFRQEIHILSDPVLPILLKRLLPASALSTIEPDLIRLGEDLVHVIRPLAPLIKDPTLTQYDAWGNRVDALHVSDGWNTLKAFACKEGVISIPYERKFQQHSRIYQFAKTMLMVADCHVVLCPYAMTDGAARGRRVVSLGTKKMRQEILPRLISSNPEKSYISGQWMTETSGGSDVSRLETQPGDLGPAYLLDGFKWFSSAAEGNISVALARSESAHGTGGLSLFLVPVRLPALPLPALQQHPPPPPQRQSRHARSPYRGARAERCALQWRIGAPGTGIRQIAPVLNITRIHSSVSSVGSLMRCLSLARAYAGVRTGRRWEASGHGARAHGNACAGERAVSCADAPAFRDDRSVGAYGVRSLRSRPCLRWRKCMAALGGQGYMEETGMGRIIRDALVEKIWEGTVEVLSHDLIRASRGKGVEDFRQWAQTIISSAPKQTPAIARLQDAVAALPSLFHKTLNPLLPRSILTLFGHVASALFLLEHATWARNNSESDCGNGLCRVRALDRRVEADIG